jgi:hypothetical protein
MFMARPDPDVLARDVRQLLTIAGLPEATDGHRGGGYQLHAGNGRVHVSWWADDAFTDDAGQLDLAHPQHPMARLDRDLVAVMERAVANLLYAAGFTVVLRPGAFSPDPEKRTDPAVMVVAGPAFRAWASG